MKYIQDNKLLEFYITRHHIDSLFSTDIKSKMKLIEFERNEYLCKEGESMDYLLFLVKGKTKVYMSLENGKRLLLCFYEGFQVIGDMEVVRKSMATTNVQVIEETHCIGIPFENVEGLIGKDVHFLTYICGTLAQKLKRCSKNSSINLLYPLENRLASYIWVTSKKDIGPNCGLIFEGNLSEIAELLGASYRHLLRVIENFCERGYLKRKKHSFEVINKEKIRDLAIEIYL